MTSATPPTRLRLPNLVAFSLPGFSVGALAVALTVYLPHYYAAHYGLAEYKEAVPYLQDAAANDGQGQGGRAVDRPVVADRVFDEIQGGAVFIQDSPAPAGAARGHDGPAVRGFPDQARGEWAAGPAAGDRQVRQRKGVATLDIEDPAGVVAADGETVGTGPLDIQVF